MLAWRAGLDFQRYIKPGVEAGETSHWLRALADLAQGPGSVPAPTEELTTTCKL